MSGHVCMDQEPQRQVTLCFICAAYEVTLKSADYKSVTAWITALCEHIFLVKIKEGQSFTNRVNTTCIFKVLKANR